eukprot:jgi/Ulvmu1/5472/UM023_0008.1
MVDGSADDHAAKPDESGASDAGQAQPDSQEAAEAAPPEMVEPRVNQEVLAQLKDMGFGHDRSVRAVHFSGNSTIQGAMNWLEEHQTDTDLDEPLRVPKAEEKPKKKLTAEEAKARAAELQARAKARREKEEKVTEKERERARIAMGKEINAAMRAEEDQKMRRLAAEREMERVEAAAARVKIREKLNADRRERRRAQGLPEELTPEEQEEERKKLEADAARQARTHLPVKPVTRINRMREIAVQMKKTTEPANFATCCKTLTAYCRNVYTALDDPAKRRINLENKAFVQRVAVVPQGREFLSEVGFVEEDGALVLPKKEAPYEKAILEGAGQILDSALTNPMFGAL